MAKRRILKRDISYVAGDLFSEALFCKLYLPGVNSEKADVVMARHNRSHGLSNRQSCAHR